MSPFISDLDDSIPALDFHIQIEIVYIDYARVLNMVYHEYPSALIKVVESVLI